ncbi:MAG: helix-turn-helix transcriptional regulator [Treponema sp.]|uniref:helix-turn-helix domain-containing protein n=1 Tax=Treponema sp. TaxID=166 RepID=UPI002A90CFCE|nr:helix-turn-helix transcriptional regulator [Treponema sp.]MDY6396910.1 helix-turn-helix transcriptional regulator [Treponema sp.]
MSPFWKNVDEEIKYLNMNLKTLAKVSGVPYPTITNGRNRENSIPEMETAKKIAAALHKPLDSLLGITGNQNTVGISEEKSDVIHLYQKYQDIISVMEDFPAPLRESLRNTIIKFHSTYELMKK